MCIKCGKEKIMEEYSNDRKKLDGKFNACKECEKKRRAVWTTENREQLREYRKKYCEKNKVAISEYNRKHYLENHDYHIQRKRKYNKDARDAIREGKLRGDFKTR